MALEQKKKLDLEVNTQKSRVEILKNERARLQEQYDETQQFILNAEKNAETIYKTKCAQLEDKYQQREKELQTIQEEQKKEYATEITKMESDLASLKATKLAAIEAARKEQLINQKQENYCLRIPIEEQNDVAILKSVRNRITKPRAISSVI